MNVRQVNKFLLPFTLGHFIPKPFCPDSGWSIVLRALRFERHDIPGTTKKIEMTRWRIGSEIEPRSYTITTKQEVPSRHNVPHCPHQYTRTCREKNHHIREKCFGVQGLMEKVTNSTSQSISIEYLKAQRFGSVPL